MKYRHLFALMLILTAFLIGSAAASENIGGNANSTYSDYISVENECVLPSYVAVCDGAPQSNDMIKEADSTTGKVDMSVDMKVGDVKKTTYGINEMSFDVPFIITAKADNGIAKNAKVFFNLPDEFEFISYDASIGSYDRESGIWDIGDLANESLTIFTKINQKGSYIISINSTSDADEDDLTNNCLECNIEVTSKISSNITRTSADRSSPQHTSHYASMAQGTFRGYSGEDIPKPNTQPADSGSDEPVNPDPNPTPGNNGENGNTNPSNNDGGGSGEISGPGEGTGSGEETGQSANPLKAISTNLVAGAVDGISNTISDILNPDSGSLNNLFNPSRIFKAVKSNNYATVPLLIFAVFLILLVGNYAYEKIKS